MAVRKLTPTSIDSREEVALRAAIAAEITRPDDTPPPADAPVIFREDSDDTYNYTHWYAVWDRFREVDPEVRSRVLLRAVEDALGREEALRVTIAMGLTRTEADAMGLPR